MQETLKRFFHITCFSFRCLAILPLSQNYHLSTQLIQKLLHFKDVLAVRFLAMINLPICRLKVILALHTKAGITFV